ncbi:hypothetical protein [Marinifilum sp. D737]|uniref:hypothetical protein n=1 Tax=Marinifilum sp. D737 TaxID=2969628 RepID=UPI00227389C2|nr:hypothetical protein [Marinifilum sp. D737]MCY1633808.1 hypothetical protein [Marinifilum sp. D737]
MNLNKTKNEKVNLDQLLGKLKKEDRNYSNLCKRMKIVYWIFIPLYTIIAFIHYFDTKELTDLIAGLLLVAAFLIFALVFGSYQKEYKNVDYSLPTLLMLKQAAERYHPFRKKSILIFLAVFLMNASFNLRSQPLFNTVESQIVFFSIFILAIIIGLVIWYFKYKPLRDNALANIAEIEGN